MMEEPVVGLCAPINGTRSRTSARCPGKLSWCSNCQGIERKGQPTSLVATVRHDQEPRTLGIPELCAASAQRKLRMLVN